MCGRQFAPASRTYPFKGVSVLSNLRHEHPGPSPEGFTHSMAVLLGLVHGILDDGALKAKEILALNAWLGNHEELLDDWPANIIAGRVRDAVADGKITCEEAEDLSGALASVLGWRLRPSEQLDPLPANETMAPFQAVIVPGRSFLFSGQFLYGTRSRCEAAVLQRGGRVDRTIGPSLDYLVLGSLPRSEAPGSEFPAVLKTARELRRKGHEISIVSEQAWARSLEVL
jgi:NAD-dependent DNA ligase